MNDNLFFIMENKIIKIIVLKYDYLVLWFKENVCLYIKLEKFINKVCWVVFIFVYL